MEHDGFISYSHAADDRLAPALQRGLQRMAKPWNARRALRIFRDETGLSTNPHLWPSIEAALDGSEWFVLLASEEAARSEWVNREVAHWRATKPVSRILPVVTDGTWVWDSVAGDFTPGSTAVPPALRGALTDEPRQLDLRWARDETDLDLRNSRFRSAVADLAAPMHGVPKDEIEGEDIRQHRRALRLARGAVAALVVLVVAALVATVLAVSQRAEANRNANESQARELASRAEALLAANRTDQALLTAVEAQRIAEGAAPHGDAAERARIALLRTVTAAPISGFLPGQREAPAVVRYSPDGSTIISATNGGEVHVWDAATRRLRQRQPPSRPAGVPSVAVNDAGLLAVSSGSADLLWDLHRGRPWRWQPPRRPDDADPLTNNRFVHVALSDSGRLAIASVRTLDLWDVNTGRRIGAPRAIAGHVQSLAFSPDGSQLALSSVPIEDNTGETVLSVQLLDVATGAAGRSFTAHTGAFSYYLAPFVDALVYSPDGRRISSIASRGDTAAPFRRPTAGGAIATFDTATGARIESSPVGAGMELMGVSPDLATLAVSDGRTMNVLDARTGARLATARIPGLDPTAPAAFDPTRPNVVVQSGPGALAVIDWTGTRPIVATKSDERVPAAAVTSPTGTAVDVTPALRRLGLSTACFAPFAESCADRPAPPFEFYLDNYFHHRFSFVADAPQRPWSATASPAGPVAILSAGEITIWDPADGRMARRLTGVPPKCTSFLPRDLAFVGTARDGRVVLACAPKLMSWDLAASTPRPAWTKGWFGFDALAGGAPMGVALSGDGTIGVVRSPEGPARIFDARTGREGPNAPSVSWDSVTGFAFSPDGKLAQLHESGSLDLVDPADGSLLQTLTSSTGNVRDSGVPVSFLGNSGAPPVISFSPDGRTVAVWHDSIGLEIWDRRSGESLAVLGGVLPAPEGTLPRLSGTGQIDSAGMHRISVSFAEDGRALRVGDVRERVGVVDGVSTHRFSGLLRTVRWSLRPSDWVHAACTVAGRDLSRDEWNELVGSSTQYHRTCTPRLRATPPG